jgi:hypothetical protein
LAGEAFCCFLGRAAAMGMGFGRGIAGCIATAVVISVTLGRDRVVLIRRRSGPGLYGTL